MTTDPTPDAAAQVREAKRAGYAEAMAEYRKTHARDGCALGSPQYPNNRAGRRALARTWRGHRHD